MVFTQKSELALRRNLAYSKRHFEGQRLIVANLLNTQSAFCDEIFGAIIVRAKFGEDDIAPTVFSVAHRNLIQVFAATALNDRGLYAAAGAVLRGVFEGLLVAKYFTLNRDRRLFDHWFRGGDISLRKSVLRQLQHPTLDELEFLWGGLCKWSHVGPDWGQVSLKFRDVKDDVEHRFVPMMMLLDCNFHLLNRCLATPPVVRLIRLYRNFQAYQVARDRSWVAVKCVRRGANRNARQLIRDYTCKWVLRT